MGVEIISLQSGSLVSTLMKREVSMGIDGSGFDDIFGKSEEPVFDARVFHRTLGSLRLPEPIKVSPTTAIVDAIETMNRHSIGCVLVVEHGSLVGIFTERDVLRRVALLPLDLSVTPISKVMTANPECLDCSDLVLHALNCMVERGFRHVPVLDRGNPVGVFGMRNCVTYVTDMLPPPVK